MSGTGKIRKIFPGGNTSCGFYSLYDYIVPQDEAARIFVIKGGPGVGKSTFVTKIAEEMVNRGYDVEHLHCSSDNDSLDGIFIPSLKIALIDGTAPHVVDPKNPGAVDEIINLGEYWDCPKIEAAKDEVLKVNKRVGKYFATAYSLLKEGKVAYDEWKGYVKDSMDWSKYNAIAGKLVESIFSSINPSGNMSGKIRHTFASAITPGGLDNHIDTLLLPGMKVYALEGDPGTGVKNIIGRIAQEAYETGLDTEQFHCPFEPEYLDMVIIPGINTAVLNVTKPFHVDISAIKEIDIVENVDIDKCIKEDILSQYSAELEDAKKRFNSLLEKAIASIHNAKEHHDTMEHYYVSAMNFDEIAKKRNEILNRILEYANKAK